MWKRYNTRAEIQTSLKGVQLGLLETGEVSEVPVVIGKLPMGKCHTSEFIVKPPNSSHPWGDTTRVELTGNPVFRMTKEKAHREYKILPRITYVRVPSNNKLNIMPAGEGEKFQYHKKDNEEWIWI